MQQSDYLKQIVLSLSDKDNKAIELSLKHVHHPNLFSLVVSGTPGNLLRIFIADEQIDPFTIQLHTHRYGIKLTPINGKIKHHIAIPRFEQDFEAVKIPMYRYKSYINGGNGLSYLSSIYVQLKDFVIPLGSTIAMNTTEFHTISCSKGSMWIVEELGFDTEESRVLGIPFNTENFYSKAAIFEIEGKIWHVTQKLMELIEKYDSIK